MTLWLLAAALTLLTLAALAWPLWRARQRAARRGDYDLSVYRDQLEELDRDHARGLISDGEIEAARREIERRMLQATSEEGAEHAKPSTDKASARVLLTILFVLLPLAALGLYWQLGAPSVPSQPFAAREQPREQAPALVAATQQLADRLAANPNDPNGWLLLSRSYVQLDLYDKAVEAVQQAIRYGDDSANAYASLGEVIAAANGGQLTPEARQAFAAALERNPNDPRGRYYGGLAYAQDGRLEQALAVWQDLADDSPPDAPWRPLLMRQLAQVRSALGLDPAPPLAASPAPSEPSQEDMAAAADMSAEERAAFIRSMVDRLATRLEDEPDDLDGWLRLARAYVVLGESQAAGDALERAKSLAADLPADGAERQEIDRLESSLETADQQ